MKEAPVDIPLVKRIELFATKGNKTYGIVRSMFVATSAEKPILSVAEASSGVVQVRILRSSGAGRRESHRSEEPVADTIVVKSTTTIPANNDPNMSQPPRLSLKVPTITVSPRWKERMKMTESDCVMVSSPIAEYAVPPPNV